MGKGCGGKGFGGSNLWELNGSSSWGGGGYDQHQGAAAAAKSTWMMNIQKALKPQPGLPKPVMITNPFETLRRAEVEDDFDMNKEEFPSAEEWNTVEHKKKTAPMGSYTKSSQKDRKNAVKNHNLKSE